MRAQLFSGAGQPISDYDNDDDDDDDDDSIYDLPYIILKIVKLYFAPF